MCSTHPTPGRSLLRRLKAGIRSTDAAPSRAAPPTTLAGEVPASATHTTGARRKKPTPKGKRESAASLSHRRANPAPRGLLRPSDTRRPNSADIYSYRIRQTRQAMVEGGGFEPPKAEPSDLQSDPFDRSGTPPKASRLLWGAKGFLSIQVRALAPMKCRSRGRQPASPASSSRLARCQRTSCSSSG